MKHILLGAILSSLLAAPAMASELPARPAAPVPLYDHHWERRYGPVYEVWYREHHHHHDWVLAGAYGSRHHAEYVASRYADSGHEVRIVVH